MIITKEESNNIRGVAILLIMLYNFTRHLVHIDGNEMTYSASNTIKFCTNVFSLEFPLYVVSFIGWIGVPLFFFMSGYGLSARYSESGILFSSYIKKHIQKLWKLMIPVYILYIAISIFLGHSYSLYSFAFQVSFLSNILNIDNIPGVYWFFSAILQFYIFFYLCKRLRLRWWIIMAIVGITINYITIYCAPVGWARYINHNFIGWLTPFSLGIIFFRKCHLGGILGKSYLILTLLCFLFFMSCHKTINAIYRDGNYTFCCKFSQMEMSLFIKIHRVNICKYICYTSFN